MTARKLYIGLAIIGLAVLGLLVGVASTKKTPSTKGGTVTKNETVSVPANAFPLLTKSELRNKQARVETDKGTIVIELFGEEAPIAVSSFMALAGKGFYNGLIFHRYVKGFVIQGGDPQGTGYGGPGYTFQDEPVTREYTKGMVAMANAGPNTNGSQFFILLDDAPQLSKRYTIFGRVTDGFEVAEQLRVGDKMKNITVEPIGS